jgi:integrase
MAIQRGTTWQANVRLLNGQRLRPGGFVSREDAELWEAQARAADARGELPPPAITTRASTAPQVAGVTLCELRKLVLADQTKKGGKGGWRGSKDEDGAAERSLAVVNFYGPTMLAQRIDKAEVKRLIAGLRMIGNTDSTINRKLAALSKMLRWGEREGLVRNPPEIERFDEPEGRLRWLEQPEEDRLLASFETQGWHDDRLLVIFLLDSGARIAEALNMTHADWGPTARFWETKGGKPRFVPLTARARAACERFAQNGLAGPFAGFNYWTFRAHFEKARQLAGLGADVVIHTLRHTCATRLALAGWDTGRLKKWMGHSSYVTTERYIKLRPTDLEEMVATLEQASNRTQSAVEAAPHNVSKLVPKRAHSYPARSNVLKLSR